MENDSIHTIARETRL